MRLLVRNIGRIVGIEREGRLRLCGAEMDRMETLDDAWLLADGGRIAAFGRSGGGVRRGGRNGDCFGTECCGRRTGDSFRPLRQFRAVRRLCGLR